VRRFVWAIFVLFVLPGFACTPAGPRDEATATTPGPLPTTPSPTLNPIPDELEAAFLPVGDFTFEPAPTHLARSQVRPIRASVKGVGQLTDVVVRMAVKEGTAAVTVTLAAIKPNQGRSTMDVFAAILGPLSQTGEVSRTLGGQAFLVSGDDFELVITPVAVQPQLLLLIAVGPTSAPVRAVVAALLERLSS
jgi:hypothetical protein